MRILALDQTGIQQIDEGSNIVGMEVESATSKRKCYHISFVGLC